jgi:hypothetical protein
MWLLEYPARMVLSMFKLWVSLRTHHPRLRRGSPEWVRGGERGGEERGEGRGEGREGEEKR